MAAGKQADVWQYGDFQTPQPLAAAVCETLVRRGIRPGTVIEPTCGQGAFLAAAAGAFAAAESMFGVEVNSEHVRTARGNMGAAAEIERGDFFTFAWERLLARAAGPLLVLGNPPWVTNSDLGLLGSVNLPAKANLHGLPGIDALTGKANFDISEWMLLAQLEWLRQRPGWLAMLVKTAVARKVLKRAWQDAMPVGRAAIYRIDAMHHFKAAADACLFVLPVGLCRPSQDCDVFADLNSTRPACRIGFHDQTLVADAKAYRQGRHLLGTNLQYRWRSGIKHDCAKIMEFVHADNGMLLNGLGEKARIEPAVLFPLCKSSDVVHGRSHTGRFLLVCQKEVSQDPARIAGAAAQAWRYLVAHASRLDARKSSIYRRRPRFSIFGVGPYTFAPWKVAVAGFYKSPRFVKIGPQAGKPVVFDDTVYFLSCKDEAEADFVLSLVASQPYMQLLKAMMFSDDKRPITAELLGRISLERVARALRQQRPYAAFASRQDAPALALK